MLNSNRHIFLVETVKRGIATNSTSMNLLHLSALRLEICWHISRHSSIVKCGIFTGAIDRNIALSMNSTVANNENNSISHINFKMAPKTVCQVRQGTKAIPSSFFHSMSQLESHSIYLNALIFRTFLLCDAKIDRGSRLTVAETSLHFLCSVCRTQSIPAVVWQKSN